MGEGMSAFVPNCNHGYAVKYNEFNKVVQCHVCGQVWIPNKKRRYNPSRVGMKPGEKNRSEICDDSEEVSEE